jgi:phosphoserine phosphatase
MSKEDLELACRDYEVIVVDLDDTLTLATGLEEFLSFHLQRKYGPIGILKTKLVSILLKPLRRLGLCGDTLFRIYVNLLLLGERYHSLRDSAFLYVRNIIKERRVRVDLLSRLRECRRNLRILVLATSNIDLLTSLISRYLGFHYFVASETGCIFTCYLRNRIAGPRKVLEVVKLVKRFVKDFDRVIYIADEWSVATEKSKRVFKNVVVVDR